MKHSFTVLAAVMALALTASAAPVFKKETPVGGNGGTPFDDSTGFPETLKLQRVSVGFGRERVEQVEVALDGATFTHGNANVIVKNDLPMQEGQLVNQIFVNVLKGKVVGLQIRTNKPGLLIAGQQTELDSVQEFNAPSDKEGLVGFSGREGDGIDSLAPIWGVLA